MRYMNAIGLLRKGLEQLRANGVRFEINQLLFAVDKTLLSDSEEKLCKLVSESGGVFKIRKLRVNVCKNKVMRCSRRVNVGRMHARLNGEPFEKVDCFQSLGSQMAADGICERDVVHRMNDEYKAC